jgi:hypothetical protein
MIGCACGTGGQSIKMRARACTICSLRVACDPKGSSVLGVTSFGSNIFDVGGNVWEDEGR